MNGWFMYEPTNWPPSNDIEPFFTSFHISPHVAKQMLTPIGIDYLRTHGPIGCRDRGTEAMLNKFNIPCYFSGCLTLVLGDKFKGRFRNGSLCFVDPYYEYFFMCNDKFSLFTAIQKLFIIISNIGTILKLTSKFQNPRYKAIFKAASFYCVYSKTFGDKVLLGADYINQNISEPANLTDTEKLDLARKLLDKYSKANCVVTSRIHCALPCLGMDTPVIFITSDKLETLKPIRGSGRFGGLIELFRVMRYTAFNLSTEDPILLTISKQSLNIPQFTNKQDHYQILEKLRAECLEFVSLDLHP